MKFSVIIPVYQVENYLRECVESLLAQTFSDYEAILVDDGSPDGCPAICDEYAAADSRFRVIHKENGGLSSARNAGLEIARGEYVYFLDSDDTIEPDLLETAASLMDAGADQVIFKHCRVLPDGSEMMDRDNLCGTFLLDNQKKRLSYLLQTLIPCRLPWSACTSVYSMEKIRKYSQRFEDNRRIFAEDMQFALCYCAHAEHIESIDRCLYHYRVREDSIMDVQKTRSNLGRLHKLTESVLSYYRRFDDCSLLTEHFDEIYYSIMAEQFCFQMWASGVAPAEYRELVRREMTDWEDMEQRLRDGMKGSGKMTLHDQELRANVLFLLGGSEWMLRLRCKILRLLKQKKKES